MEFAEFAESILFGNRLNDKLFIPDVLTDLQPGHALRGSPLPGRPPELNMSLERSGASAANRQKFPSAEELGDSFARGRVLHFFANHELLALELMALVLLRFPEAPPAFRRGLVQTMKDEQKHLRLYVEHMKDLGVPFGSQPLNGFFWKILSSVDSPNEFVSSMSLTFEQANLDFAIAYRKIFAHVGDEHAASIMDAVLEDEVRHVRHGLEWFRRWKDPGLSDWEAYLTGLRPPMTPARAKGFHFDAQLRRRCGFDQGFIDALETCGASKGRPPIVHIYNPGQEFEIGTPGLAYTQSNLIDDIARDLEFLMAWLCSPGDVLALRSIPSPEFLKSCTSVLKTPPEFVLFDSSARRIQWQAGRKVEGLRPWGWSQQMFKLADRLSADSLKSPRQEVYGSSLPRPESLRFASKLMLPELRRDFFLAHSNNAFAPPPDFEATREAQDLTASQVMVERDVFGLATVVCDSLESVSKFANSFASVANSYVVVKAPFGSSGHNQLRIRPGLLTSNDSFWIKKALATYRGVLIEPWREVVAEFSVHASCSGIEVPTIHGVVRNLSSKNGQYLASAFGRNMWDLDPEVRSFISGFKVFERLKDSAKWVGQRLEHEGYRGPFGIDSYVYRRRDGALDLCLIGEINLRHTMGRIALELSRRCQSGKTGILALVGANRIGSVEENFKDSGVGFSECENGGGFSGGFLRLAPPRLDSRVVPVLWLGSPAQAESAYRLFCAQF